MQRPAHKSAKAIPGGSEADVETAPSPPLQSGPGETTQQMWLVILWSAHEPHRMGERVYCEDGQRLVLGRAPQTNAGEIATCFAAVRPDELGGSATTGHEILGQALSRRQLEIRAEGSHLAVRNVGRCPMWINGALLARGRVQPGDTIHLQQQVLLLCVNGPKRFPSLSGYPRERLGAFGMGDRDGLVGESPAMWNLRRQLQLCGHSEDNVLIVGKSGSGKDLAAHALHQMSPRHDRPFVAENIATVPSSLGTAVLFGSRRNFPNPGMDERPGLIGMAEGGTLFLDEIGDMSPETQPLLLRVMERHGEYARLGEEALPRRANVRFFGATNHPERLRPELRRRFSHEIRVPDLNERREDIPLLIRHILVLHAQRRQRLGRYLQNGQPHLDPLLLEQLVRHGYSTEVSELAFLLDQAAMGHEEPMLFRLPAEILERRKQSIPSAEKAIFSASRATMLPTSEQAQRALDLESGSVRLAANRLGISRYQLYRLIQQHGLVAKRNADGLDDGDADGD